MKKYAINLQGSDTEYIVDDNAYQSWIKNEELIPVVVDGVAYKIPRGQFNYFNEVIDNVLDTRDYEDILESFTTPSVAEKQISHVNEESYQQPTAPTIENVAEFSQQTFVPKSEPLVVKETKKISLSNNSGQQSDIEALLTEADEVRAKIKELKAEIDTPSTDWNNTIEMSKIFKKRLTYLENYWGQLIIQIKVYNIYKENF